MLKIFITLQYKVLLIMSEKNYLQDLSEIKNIMNRSTRFMSLSGLSGIMAGIYALIGAFLAKQLLANYLNYNHTRNTINPNNIEIKLIVIALLVALLSIITAYILTKKKASKKGQTIWNSTTKRLLFHFFIPLAAGGVFSLTMLNQGFYGFVAPATLIFYGLAVVNASNFTFSNVKYLGIAEIILGLISLNYIGYGLYFWAVGFGILHIIYGTIMYIKEKA
jgi:MFS family permease